MNKVVVLLAGVVRWPGLSRRETGSFKVETGLLNWASVEWSERSERNGNDAQFNSARDTHTPER